MGKRPETGSMVVELPQSVHGRQLYIDNLPRELVGKPVAAIRAHARLLVPVDLADLNEMNGNQGAYPGNRTTLERVYGTYFGFGRNCGNDSEPAPHLHVDGFGIWKDEHPLDGWRPTDFGLFARGKKRS